ncbi:glycerate kinase [Croceitalea sp. MTPC9]|uniref:glycerate kinase n=1 Tax=unclassified Croceitalea TaxID=2632280 RepID=UPI002B36AC08|nr:glycerate kinase [Croceitalea sp. MTPC6]GMN18408.1 glycerate kinase [Croceitalea sp. MTPC9]
MKFVLAPDKYKGSLTGIEFCDAAEKGLRMVFADANIIKLPLADGGDGTIEVVKTYLNADSVELSVSDPLFRPIHSSYLLSDDKKTAFIEMSEASGYKLLNKSELNCMHTTSLGTGNLIFDALNKGVQEIILGIGGSATNDGGMGMGSALGFEFLDRDGNRLSPTGINLINVVTIKKSSIHKGLANVKVNVACDVSNPFYGPDGAAYVYGPQKGANPEEVKLLDMGLKNFAKVIKSELGIDVQNINGCGAAGGLGGGAVAFLNARLKSGIDLIKEISDFDNAIKDVDWVITGEGRLDAQTLSGKTIAGVLSSAKRKGIPVAALCGSVLLTPKEQDEAGLNYVVAVSKETESLEVAMKNSYGNLIQAAYNFGEQIIHKQLFFIALFIRNLDLLV